MSNEVGTHIGYCIHMKKPHYTFRQSLSFVATNAKEQSRFNTIYKTEEQQIAANQKEEVAALFSTYNPKEITEPQREIVNKFWGTDSVKSAKELRTLFEN